MPPEFTRRHAIELTVSTGLSDRLNGRHPSSCVRHLTILRHGSCRRHCCASHRTIRRCATALSTVLRRRSENHTSDVLRIRGTGCCRRHRSLRTNGPSSCCPRATRTAAAPGAPGRSGEVRSVLRSSIRMTAASTMSAAWSCSPSATAALRSFSPKAQTLTATSTNSGCRCCRPR